MAGLFILLKQKLCVAPRPLQLNSMVTISDCPSELLFLLPFLQRANEMNDSQPVLAYYCKYYAISFALGGGPSGKFQRSPQTDAFVSRLFDDLEAVSSQADQVYVFYSNFYKIGEISVEKSFSNERDDYWSRLRT